MNICVFGASSREIDKKYIKASEELGFEIGRRGHSLVFGGGGSGVMGAVACSVYKYGGEITGVAPSFFNVDGVLYKNCSELIFTETIRERKQVMEDRSDAFVVAPGGIGTFEEFFEMLTLKQLLRHNKSIVLYNYAGFYEWVNELIKNAAHEHFLKESSLRLYEMCDDAKAVLDYIESYAEATVEQKGYNKYKYL